MQKLGVAILGATGAVGQRFIQLLENHPWFEVREVIGSDRSAGRLYGEAVNWVLDGSPPESVTSMRVKPLDSSLESLLVFSALPKEAAETREMELAAAMPVVMALAPLRKFGVSKLLMVSAQAISGAGYPGVASLDILDNVIPYVSGDEQKLETETLRMLGNLRGEQVEWLDTVASASCNRVPVVDGHLVTVSVELREKPSTEDIIDAWETFRAPEPVPQLPSAPLRPVEYLPQIDRPQIRRDRNAGNGMATSVGRLRPCPVLGYKFSALSHNTIRGAAGCSILNAELMAVQGYLAEFQPSLEAVL
jgi:aspartate-semialdehyde dehydrogenase